MGLISAVANATSGVLADQWKEYFYCESIPADILVVKGKKKTSGRFSGNKGNDNIISNGSVIAVADGQCMIIVDQGNVVELCAEPGEFIYDMSTEPSFFDGDKLSKNIKEMIASIKKRVAFAGGAPKDQRVYYFNTKEIVGNKYGTPSPVPFRVVDANVGLDVDISLKCFGEYSYKITNPILFYTNVCGNVSQSYDRTELEGQLRTELLTALQPAFGRLSEMGIRYSAVASHTSELADALNLELSSKWLNKRGIQIVAFGISSLKADPEDEKMIKELQREAAYKNTNMAAAALVNAQAQAMKDAANNAGGAAIGFMGMNMAQQAGGLNAGDLYNMSAQQQAAAASAKPADTWTCEHGHTASGNFCPECGAKKPAPAGSWTCECGSVNTGKFCPNCGAKKPESGACCSKCGWTTDGPAPKFCPECGTAF